MKEKTLFSNMNNRGQFKIFKVSVLPNSVVNKNCHRRMLYKLNNSKLIVKFVTYMINYIPFKDIHLDLQIKQFINETPNYLHQGNVWS